MAPLGLAPCHASQAWQPAPGAHHSAATYQARGTAKPPRASPQRPSRSEIPQLLWAEADRSRAGGGVVTAMVRLPDSPEHVQVHLGDTGAPDVTAGSLGHSLRDKEDWPQPWGLRLGPGSTAGAARSSSSLPELIPLPLDWLVAPLMFPKPRKDLPPAGRAAQAEGTGARREGQGGLLPPWSHPGL